MSELYRNKPVIRYKWIIAGLFFFINPNLSVFDFLPDFIGAGMIIFGFFRLAEIDDKAYSARKAFMILALADAAKMLTVLLLLDSSGTVWNLIFTLCFGMGEGALFAYAVWKLHEGISYQAMRHSCEKGYTGFSSVVGLSVLVAVLKNLLSMLPHLTELSTDLGTVSGSAASDAQIASFLYSVLTVLNIVAVTGYGIGWWIYMLRYFKTVGKEKEFLEGLGETYYRDVGSKNEVLTYRALKSAGLLIILGLLFLFPLRLDGLDFLPDYLAGILMCLGVLILMPLYRKPCKRALICGAVYTVLSAAEWIYTIIFNNDLFIGGGEKYYDSVSTVLLQHSEKLPSYFLLVGIGVAKFIALAVFLCTFSFIFSPIIENHTGSPYEHSLEQGLRKSMEVRKTLYHRRAVFLAFSFLAVGAGVFYRIFRMFLEGIAVEYSETVAVLGLFVSAVLFLSKLEEGIDNKYYMARD